MLQPLGTFAVVPRHEWENRQAAVRPMQYIVIDTLGPCFDEALIRIQAETEIGVAVTGVDVGRRGKLSWIQVTGYSWMARVSDQLWNFKIKMFIF